MYKKVNIEALCEAVSSQSVTFRDTTAHQYKSIVYVCPKTYDYDMDGLVGVSLRLTGQWNRVTVTSPEAGDYVYMHPRLLLSVRDLLLEFIVEGEGWTEEEPENRDGHE